MCVIGGYVCDRQVCSASRMVKIVGMWCDKPGLLQHIYYSVDITVASQGEVLTHTCIHMYTCTCTYMHMHTCMHAQGVWFQFSPRCSAV